MSTETQIETTSEELSVYDGGAFEKLYKVAEVMANTSTIPDSLVVKGSHDKTVANCFRVAEQSYRWGMSPFAVIDCAAVIHGKLSWEGKLVSALLDKQLGIVLKYELNGKEGDDLGVIVSGTLPGEDEPRTVQGTVRQWKTTGNGSPWKMSDKSSLERQLRYRGAREWKNAYCPGVMLGVVTIDEAKDLNTMKRAEVPASEALPIPKTEQPPEQRVESQTLKKLEGVWEKRKSPSGRVAAACRLVGSSAENFNELTQLQAEKLIEQMEAKAPKSKAKVNPENPYQKNEIPKGELNLEGGIA